MAGAPGLRFGLAPRLHQGATALHLFARGGAVLFGNLAGGRPVQIEARGRCHQRPQVGRARGVAVQEDRQRLAAEHPRRALLDVGLDAQLDRARRSLVAEQRRKALG